MSKNILFISEQKLKDSSMLSDNVDPKQLLPIVKVCQDIYIESLLGTALYRKLQNDIINNTVSGNYKILLDDYLTDVLIWYTLAESPITIHYKLSNKGVEKRTSESTQTSTYEEVLSLMDSYQRKATVYAQRAIDYLCENQNSFPEYVSPGSGVDTIQPDQTQYTCGIFLGNPCSIDNRSFEDRYQGNHYKKPL